MRFIDWKTTPNRDLLQQRLHYSRVDIVGLFPAKRQEWAGVSRRLFARVEVVKSGVSR